MTFKERDIVRVTHYQSKFAGMLGEVREIAGSDWAYVEFNNREGNTQDGRMIGFSEMEWVYSPNGATVPSEEVAF